MAPRLLGISGPLKGTAFALSDGEVSIGRDSSNHLWTVDPALSRRHCAVVGGAGRFTIRDLGSHNGTLINGLPIEQQQLRDQDQISVGESVLVFVVGEPVAQHERSPVEFAETAEMATKPVLLRQEDSLYLHSRSSLVGGLGPCNKRFELIIEDCYRHRRHSRSGSAGLATAGDDFRCSSR